jgi:hypothetical protein
MKNCPHCGISVIPTSDGYCPSCKSIMPIKDDVNIEELPNASIKVEDNKNTKDLTVEQYKRTKDWFIIIENKSDKKSFLDLNNFSDQIQNGLINGNLDSNTKIEGHFKNKDAKWETENTTIKKFVNDFYKLSNLYEPVWNNALVGLKWGAYAGIALKVVDTLILLGSVDLLLAFFFLLTIGVIFIPRIGIIGVIVLSFLMTRYTGMNFFTMALSAGLTGAILGCLPGMFSGGLYGLIRRNSIPRAHDAISENTSVLLKAIILPFIGGISLILIYIYIFNPWLQSVLE